MLLPGLVFSMTSTINPTSETQIFS